uniref:Uncharacterized protein n=1 Tax=Strombidium rassoulzadegani TaxID=1082188 RepID=A0A7S3FUP2_9SPIT|mmetsp:Transcript_16550/g.28143  ORF Transcript_16550/g.28143 Transcript_16550/m.28143 type:complete len:108 (+) Transcript_16550:395-718(+)
MDSYYVDQEEEKRLEMKKKIEREERALASKYGYSKKLSVFQKRMIAKKEKKLKIQEKRGQEECWRRNKELIAFGISMGMLTLSLVIHSFWFFVGYFVVSLVVVIVIF